MPITVDVLPKEDAAEPVSGVIGSDPVYVAPIVGVELPQFYFLVHRFVSPFYPGTENSYSQKLIGGTSLICGGSTVGRMVWAIRDRGATIGFCVATEKRTGAVKLGPLVLDEDHRKKGYARQVVELLAEHYGALGRSWMFMTAPVENAGIRALARRCGFQVQAILARHYSDRWDEAVYGRPLESGNNGKVVTRTAAVYQFGGGEMKPARIVRKRGGAVKISGLWPDVEYLDKKVRDCFSLGARKVYSLISEDQTEIIDFMHRAGFKRETGSLCSGVALSSFVRFPS